MTAKQLIKQFYCSWCDVEPWKASEGNLSDKEMNRIRSYEGNEQEMIDIITPESNNITEIISMVEGNHQREGYDMVIFDHLQLLSADVQGNRTQELTKVSRRLALLRNRLEVCLIAISQLNRKVEDRNPPKPKLSDLRETGALEQDANKVMMIYRDEYYKGSDEANEGVAEINICKHRGGPTGKVEIAWDGKMMRFGDFHPEPQSFGN
jgi:replicative DNA helicase